jgi:NADPH:quinone reductase-like Zn-dependent oxidoreductase
MLLSIVSLKSAKSGVLPSAVAPGVKTEPLARIPDGVTDEQAAALPIAGISSGTAVKF